MTNNTVAAQREFRTDSDSIGKRTLPMNALYGIHSLRASENFNYSGETLSIYPRLVAWLSRIKMVIADVNAKHGKISDEQSRAIMLAANELANGAHKEAFIVDVLEGAGGTSINMNINEVIANRALEVMGHVPGQYEYLDPLDHVALAQSTSDVLLTATRLVLIEELEDLAGALKRLARSFREKEGKYAAVLKLARTCLQDCMPMRLGQAFGAYATLCERLAESALAHLGSLAKVPIGGTGIGSGLGTYPGYRRAVLDGLSTLARRELTSNADLFDAIQNLDEFAAASATIKTVALSLGKVASDVALLSSGPDAGLNEIRLAAVQAGSSMIPGKVNPVHAMGMSQAAFFIAGIDQAVALAASGGRLETNDYLPLIVTALMKSARACREAIVSFDERCIQTLTVNEEHSTENLVKSAAIAPVLKQALGYKKAAELVLRAHQSGKTVADIAVSDNLITLESITARLKEATVLPAANI
jgi:aspartate ammonia-lyase